MRAAKVDANQSAIVAALRAAGCSVQSLARLGDGVPDLLVGRSGGLWLIEVKRPSGPRGGTSGRTLTPDQAEWWAAWRGRKPIIVTTPEEALAAVGLGQMGVPDRPCHSLEDVAEHTGAI